MLDSVFLGRHRAPVTDEYLARVKERFENQSTAEVITALRKSAEMLRKIEPGRAALIEVPAVAALSHEEVARRLEALS
jgi:hypothetical protein